MPRERAETISGSHPSMAREYTAIAVSSGMLPRVKVMPEWVSELPVMAESEPLTRYPRPDKRRAKG